MKEQSLPKQTYKITSQQILFTVHTKPLQASPKTITYILMSGHLFCTHKMPKRTYNVDRRVSPRVIYFLFRQIYTLGSAIGCQIRPRRKPRESRILQHSPFGTPGEPKGIQSVPQGSWISCSAKSTLWDRKLDAKFVPEGSP